MGLDVLLYDGKKKACPEVPSEKYPDHHCNKTYLRSSYNEAGFNSVVSLLCDGKDLYYIFGVDEPEGGVIRPDWAASRKRAAELLEALRKVAAEMPFQVATIPVSAGFGPGPQIDAREALAIFRAECKKERSSGWDSYSNGVGTFFLGTPLEVVAAIGGVYRLETAAIHLVFKARHLDSYVQTAEIVVEFIDYARTLKRPWILWSP